jgi:hypothetical protein
MGWVGVLSYIVKIGKMPKKPGVVHSQLPINISMYYPNLPHRPFAAYCFYLVYYNLKETIMKLVESNLKIKSTAALRQEIIKELTQPDKSLELLLAESSQNETKDIETDSDREGDRVRE